MIRKIIYTFLLIVIANRVAAQNSLVDSLVHEASITKNDTIKLILFGKLSNEFTEINPDSSYYYSEKMLSLAKRFDLQLEEVQALAAMGYDLINMGNYPRSLQTLLSAISIAEDRKSEKNILPARFPATDEFTDRSIPAHMQRLTKLSNTLQYMGILYVNSGNNNKAFDYYQNAITLAKQSNNLLVLSTTYSTLGKTYSTLKHQDSALICLQKAYDYAIKADYKRYLGSILLNIGRVYMAMGKQPIAIEYFRKALEESREHDYFRGVVATDLILAGIYKQAGEADSSLYFIHDGLSVANYLNAPDLLLRSYTSLADYYKTYHNSDSAVKYQSLVITINDSLFNKKQIQQFQNIDFDEQQRQEQIETAKSAYRYQLRMYALLAGIGIFILIAIILWRNNLHKQKAFALLKKQKLETDKQKAKVEHTLAELESTQVQLIQSEKMASLGELTAGIAHEIQNPLNFVNNFSEVNTELIDELEQEANNGNIDEIKAIAKDIKENEQKINHHGKRADAIVKNMLQHSRTSTGQKEASDINALCDEYLRLAYHGLRAKDKSFNAEFKTDFDESIGKINIVPQDIGRVLLNLYNNAFYAVNEKAKQQPNGYEPTILVSSKKINNKVELTVKDNGNGIPQKVVDKIFQPFFTTKPTGQGTGLGLSLSYDIVKAHGGELKVETKEGEGTTFSIILSNNI